MNAHDNKQQDRNLRKKLNKLAYYTDSSIVLPGGYRVGWDGVIGLIPGIGDVAGLLLSSYLIHSASKLGASKSLLTRMSMNAAIETLLGTVPIAGDLFDLAFKANQRNLNLLEKYLDAPRETNKASKVWVFSGFAIGALLLVTALVLMMRIITWAWQLVF